jgi:hypothetical protein
MQRIQGTHIDAGTGLPVAGPTVTIYYPGTTTAVPGAEVFADEWGAASKGNPFVGDANGDWFAYLKDGHWKAVVSAPGLTDDVIEDVNAAGGRHGGYALDNDRRYVLANAYYDRNAAQWKRIATGTAAWAIEAAAAADYVRFLRAAAGANPIAWTEVGKITSGGFAGGFGFADGTAAAPGVYFTADVDVGLYRPAANVLGAAAGGAERFRVTTTGVATGAVGPDQGAWGLTGTGNLTLHTAAGANVLELSTARGDGATAVTGRIGWWWPTQSVTYQQMAYLSVQADGGSANQRGSRMQFAVREGGVAGAPAVAWSITHQGHLLPTGNLAKDVGASGTLARNVYGQAFVGWSADTAASPSHTWDTDTNTGMFRQGSDVIGWSTTGVERMRLGSATTERMVFAAGTPRGLQVSQWTADAAAAAVFLDKSRGTAYGVFDAVAAADNIGQIFFRGADGTAMVVGASINTIAAEAFSGTARGTQLVLRTATIGGTALNDRVIVDSTGLRVVSGQLYVTEADSAAAPGHTWNLDLDTGFFRQAANVIGVSTGGTERVRFNNAYTLLLLQATANYTLSWSNPGAARTLTIPDPGASDSFAFLAATQTFTNKTLTAPVLGGTVTGVYTIGGTPTIASPTFTGSFAGTYTIGGTPTLGAATLSGTLSRAGDQTVDLTGGATRTLLLENSTAGQVANLEVDGSLFFRNNTAFTMQLVGTPTANRVFTFPNVASATVALLSNHLGNFAATTSAQLAGIMSDETGSGALVFGTSPTLVTPTVADLSNMQHDHEDAAGGGTLGPAALTNGIVYPLNRQFAAADVTNTTVETTVFTFTVPGGTLSTTRRIVLWYQGTVKQDASANENVRYRVKFGATTVFDSQNVTLTQNATHRPVWIECHVQAYNSAGAQKVSTRFGIGGTNVAGLGNNPANDLIAIHDSAAEASGAAKALAVTVQWPSTASALLVAVSRSFVVALVY